MRKILVISPSGAVYNHDCVRWYDETLASLDHYHNIGDAFVFDSSLKLLDFEKLGMCDIRNVDQKNIDRYNAEFDYVFLRGSNWIHGGMDWENASQILPKLKIPIIAFGVGAQAPATGKIALSESSQYIWKLISERSTSLGVRGTYTAQVLWDIGVRNTRIVGCPTAFRNNDPDLRIDLPPLESVRDVGFTVRREVSSLYSPDIAKYLSRHRDAIKQMAKRFDIRLMMQGEVEEKRLIWGNKEQRNATWAWFKTHEMLGKHYMDGEMERLYRTKLFYSDLVADYEALVRQKDLVLGYRLHGNLMALSNAVPSVYFTYDSRTEEFADTFAIPSYNVYADKPFVLEEFWDQSLFERFNRSFHMRYREMRQFLDENGIANKMFNREPVKLAGKPAEPPVVVQPKAAEAPKAEQPKVAPQKAEPPKPEQAKAESPKAEQPKVEPPKAAQPVPPQPAVAPAAAG